MFSIQNYSVRIGDLQILHDCFLDLEPGSVHVLMGPNGSGKSSLVTSLMGHPLYELNSGKVFLQDTDITDLPTHQKSLHGLFLAVQHSVEIEGLSVLHFLQELLRVHSKNTLNSSDILSEIKNLLHIVGFSESILSRFVNVGFSGGEKKRFELLVMLLLKPKVIMLDEIDSGVDVDGLKMITQVLLSYKKQYPEVIMLLVTHYRKIVDYIRPDFVHVMIAGRIVQSGDKQLLDAIENFGYEQYEKRS